MKISRALSALPFLALVLTGCGWSLLLNGSSNKTVAQTESSITESQSATAVTFSTLAKTVLDPKCLSCHFSGGQAPDLSSYSSIMESGSVVAGNPSGSSLYNSVASGAMPQSGGPLNADEVQAVFAWIQEGAQNDDSVPVDFSYSAHSPVYVLGEAIVPNTPSNQGGPITSYAIQPALPQGLPPTTPPDQIAPGDYEAGRMIAIFLSACDAARQPGAMIVLQNGNARPNSYVTAPFTANAGTPYAVTFPNVDYPNALGDSGGTYNAGFLLCYGPSSAPSLDPSGACTTSLSASSGSFSFALDITSVSEGVAKLYLSAFSYLGGSTWGGVSNLTHGYATMADVFDFPIAIDKQLVGLLYKSTLSTSTMKSLGSNPAARVAPCNTATLSTCNPDSAGADDKNFSWNLSDWEALPLLDWKGPTSGNGLNALGAALGQAGIVYQFMVQRVVGEICPGGGLSQADQQAIATRAQTQDSFGYIVAAVASSPSCR